MYLDKKYYVLGCMSGTSLDGVDIAYCSFSEHQSSWHFSIIKAETFPYPAEWKNKLGSSDRLKGRELFHLDHEYGKYLGKLILEFILKHQLKPDFIASHGHTVFHEPDNAGSLQIGNGHDISAETSLTVIADFRSMDIALGGQGAPLVPVGDMLLFDNYRYCLNLGGFSNISYTEDSKRIAFDICPVNSILNRVSNRLGLEYDKNGEEGRKGKVIIELLEKLNGLEFYKTSPPRSLGAEFLNRSLNPLIVKYLKAPNDLLATIYEHIAFQISRCVNQNTHDNILVTGGGAYNQFLIEKMTSKIKNPLVIPENILIDFKEALIFAFLGLLRHKNKPNCLASVTGSSKDTSAGIIFDPNL
jgi:anhydro-N-acetylmuramic acid kinase